MSNKLIAAGLLSIGVLAGCSTASGPTFNANQIRRATGAQDFRVECHGLFDGVAACVKQAQKICGDKPAYKLETMERLRSPSDDASDPRVLTFQCGAPAQPEPAAAEDPAPAPQPAPEMPR